ncbi:hypothetical protein GSI_00085 [Ganoderma sinense ZZ0214-1]|uniref:Uncharacterized protein n=1 Tax=Ganoderma sinense ZZ0214-1 TaxID=1077348 RepID=A0A2G8SRK4_9APHY|nr:hypothetical protein GSI_00085 [Ganoderma sinense ZZ0214-1]
MTPVQQSEDFIRALSRIVFACMPPGQFVIKLFDPTTGVLEEYKLVKLSPTGESYSSRSMRHPYLVKARSPPPLDMDDILHFFNVVVRKENALQGSRRSRASSLSSTFSQLQTLSRHNSKSRSSARPPLASKSIRISAASEDSSDTGDLPVPSGPLTQTKRAMFYGEAFEDRRRPFAFLPPASLGLGKNSTPPLEHSHPSDADTSSSSADCTPAKALFPDDSSFDTSNSTIGFGSSRPSRLVGLGFTALVKDDGSPFDGLGALNGRLYDNLPSPSDEARARARERRDRRVFSAIQVRDDPRTTPQSSAQFQSQAQTTIGQPFAVSAKVTTPVTVTERVPPAAPAKRLVGRLPLGAEQRMVFRAGQGREKKLERDVFAFQRSRASPEWRISAGRAQGTRGGPSKVRGLSSSSLAPPSSADSAAAESSLGNELRFWSYWMTPMNEAAGSAGRPAWRP